MMVDFFFLEKNPDLDFLISELELKNAATDNTNQRLSRQDAPETLCCLGTDKDHGQEAPHIICIVYCISLKS